MILRNIKYTFLISDIPKPELEVVQSRIGMGEQPDERENEIVIELDREHQFGRTQPRANGEPQGEFLFSTYEIIDFMILTRKK